MMHYLLFRIFKELLYGLARMFGLFHHGMIMTAIVFAVIGAFAYKLFYRRQLIKQIQSQLYYCIKQITIELLK